MSDDIIVEKLNQVNNENFFVTDEIVKLKKSPKEKTYTFSENLIKLRGHRQSKEIAKEIGIDRSTLERYERGERKPDIEMALKIAEYYEVSLDYLVKGVSSENIAINQMTGLSEEATENLKALNYSIKIESKKVLEILNVLVENFHFQDFALKLFDYLIKANIDTDKITKNFKEYAYGKSKNRTFLNDFQFFSETEKFIDELINDETLNKRLINKNREFNKIRKEKKYENYVDYEIYNNLLSNMNKQKNNSNKN